jgi:hypothetical protein
MKSKVLMEEPSLAKPYIDMDEPKRAKARQLTADPTWKKSSMDNELAQRS